MARGKKKETLTPEERLQAALVPVSEQPYKVPGNWCWTYIKFGFDVTSSKRVHKEDWLSQGIPFYRTRELVKLSENGCVDNELFISEKLYNSFVAEYGVPQKGDLLISGVGTIGVPYVINENQKFYFKDGNIIWFKNRGLFHPKYVYFLYKSTFIDNQIHQMSSGTTVDTYTIINANATVVPLPPFSEQQRIIDRIESLFAKLDEARQKAQGALDSFETRKAAILHRAFTGELTARWRKERGIGMDSWERLKLGEIGTLERGRSQHRPRNDPRLFGGPYPFIQTGDVASANVYITEHHQTLSEFGMEQSRMFSAETLCITIAANIGDVAILSYDCCFPDSVVGFIPNNRSISKFVYYMMSVLQKELEDNAPATAQKNINLKILNAVEMNIPPVIEQAEIVRRLDNLLAKEQQAKDAAEGVLEQIDLIKKAILARAFRGELGTNDPSEESAVELVKRVLAVEPPPEARAKAVSIPREVEKQLKCELERKIMKLYYYSDSRSLPINTLMEVSSKKFEVLESIRNLEQRGIIKKLPNGNYKLVR